MKEGPRTGSRWLAGAVMIGTAGAAAMKSGKSPSVGVGATGLR